jgi:hypothetical protein
LQAADLRLRNGEKNRHRGTEKKQKAGDKRKIKSVWRRRVLLLQREKTYRAVFSDNELILQTIKNILQVIQVKGYSDRRA